MEINLPETIRSLIQNNDLGKALYLLEQAFRSSNDTKHLNDVITWQAQIKEIEDKRAKNLITEEEYRMHKARIVVAVLDLLSELNPILPPAIHPAVPRKAKLAHNIPPAMQVGQLYLCHIKMAENKRDLVIHAGDTDRTIYELKGVENLMEVHLESVEKGAFWIKPVRHLRIQQGFSPGSVAEWGFDVVPQQPGKHHLRLNVVALVHQHGKKQSRNQIMSIGVEVAVNTAQSVTEWKSAITVTPVTLSDRIPIPGRNNILTSALLLVVMFVLANILDLPKIWREVQFLGQSPTDIPGSTPGRQVRLFIVSPENSRVLGLAVSGVKTQLPIEIVPHTWGVQMSIPATYRGGHQIKFEGDRSKMMWEVDSLYDGCTLYTSLPDMSAMKDCGIKIRLDPTCIISDTSDWKLMLVRPSRGQDTIQLRAYPVGNSTLYASFGWRSSQIISANEHDYINLILKEGKVITPLNTSLIQHCITEAYYQPGQYKYYNALLSWDRDIKIDSVFMDGVHRPDLKPALPQRGLVINGLLSNPFIRIVGEGCECTGKIQDGGNYRTVTLTCKCVGDPPTVAAPPPPKPPEFEITIELDQKWVKYRNDLRFKIDDEYYFEKGIHIIGKESPRTKPFYPPSPPKVGKRKCCIWIAKSASLEEEIELDCIDLPMGRHYILLNAKNQLVRNE